MTDYQQVSIYLPPAEVKELEEEAEREGRSGVSAQIRWILGQRRSANARVD